MRRLLAVLAALSLLAGPGVARAAPPEVISATLLPGWATEDGGRMAGLRLRLAEGWKTYWRAPGMAGIPPRFDWSGSENLSGVSVHFPRPGIFEQAGLRIFGYAREVVWPLEVAPERAGEAVRLRGTVSLGVCREVCIPTELRLDSVLPAAGGESGRGAIRAALARRPVPAAEAGVGAVSCTLAPGGDGLALTARIEVPRLGRSESVVVEPADPSLWAAPAEVRRSGGTLVAETDLVAAEGGGVALDRSGLRLTLIGDATAVSVSGCPAPR